jgi:transcriptional regulator with XRE-family HTH domain
MRLQRWRKRRGLSQDELAKKSGVTRGYIARLETQRHDPRISIVAKLAKALKVKIGDLVD